MKREYEIPEFVICHFDNIGVVTTSFGDNEIEDEWGATIPEV